MSIPHDLHHQSPAAPDLLPDRIALAIPERIRSTPCWLLWKKVPHPQDGSRFGKIPYYANGKRRSGRNGSPDDIGQLVPFNEAAEAFRACDFDGFGVATLARFGFSAGDFDHCLRPGTADVPEWMPEVAGDTYLEISPSGTGIRAFWSGTGPSWKDHAQGCEFFGDTGFVTVTGNVLRPNDLTPVPEFFLRHTKPWAGEAAEPLSSGVECWVDESTLADLASALQFLDADDRDIWIKTGMALRELGEEGFALWDEWSQTSPKYQPGECRRKWNRDIKPGAGLHFESVFAMATQAGWVNPLSKRTQPEDDFDFDFEVDRSEIEPSPQAAVPERRSPSAAQRCEPPGRRPIPAAPAPVPAFDAERYKVPPLESLTLESVKLAQLTPKVIVPDYLYADLAVLAAPGGTGKTTLMLWESVLLALGEPIYGHCVPEAMDTLFITAEDSAERLKARLYFIMEAMGLVEYEMRNVLSRIRFWDVSGKTLRFAEVVKGNIELTPLADEIVAAFQGQRIGIINIDPTVSFGPGERMVNDSEQAIVTACRRIVRGLDCCVRLIHHTGQTAAREKLTDQYAVRGGTALPDGARMVAVLQPEPEPSGITLEPGESCLLLSRPKNSYGPRQDDIWLIRNGFSFHYYAPPSAAQKAEDKERQLDEDIDELCYFLDAETDQGAFYAKTALEIQGVLSWPRQRIRQVISAAETRNRVVVIEKRRPGPGKHPRVLITAERYAASTAEKHSGQSNSAKSRALINSPPPRERKNGGVIPADFLSSSLDSAGGEMAEFGGNGVNSDPPETGPALGADDDEEWDFGVV